jgi:hypothetical protein
VTSVLSNQYDCKQGRTLKVWDRLRGDKSVLGETVVTVQVTTVYISKSLRGVYYMCIGVYK